MNRRDQYKIAILASFACLLWGSAFPVTKLSYTLLSIDSSLPGRLIGYAGLRFVLAGLLLMVFYRGRLARFNGVIRRQSVIIALFQTVLQYTFFYIGVSQISGTKASIIAGSNVFISLVISAVIFRQERLTPSKLFGCLIGFMGIVLINIKGVGSLGGFEPLGDGLILLSTVAYAISTNLMKRYGKISEPESLATFQFLIGGVVMLIYGSIDSGIPVVVTAKGWLVLLYLAAVSAVAYTIWSRLLKRYPVSSVVIYGSTTPFFGVVFSAICLGEFEILTQGNMIVGLMLVCIGILVVNIKGIVKSSEI